MLFQAGPLRFNLEIKMIPTMKAAVYARYGAPEVLQVKDALLCRIVLKKGNSLQRLEFPLAISK